jgi:hypothetical protein
MSSVRPFALLMAPVLASLLGLACLAAQARADATSARLLSDEELSQVHAAGLPEPDLQRLASGLPLAGLPLAGPEVPLVGLNAPDLCVVLDRQQALAQARLAAATTQGSLGLMQLASLPALVTPLAPLFLPTLAMPFPLFMAPPPKKSEPGH